MSINKIGLIGATGNVGPAILKGLLDGGYEVTILSRAESTSTNSLASHPRQKIVKVDFDNVNSITSAMQGIEGVVSNLASHALLSQKKMIDAAVAAGVKRFIPSDFGADLTVENNKTVPLNIPKVEIDEYLMEKAKAYPDFSYSFIWNGPFFDWCLSAGIFGNFKTHEMTLWDGGDVKVSTTTLPSVGKAVASVFKNLEATKNKAVRIADTTITLKELIEIAKEIDGNEWKIKAGSTSEVYELALEELKKPSPNMNLAIMNQLMLICFGAENGHDFEDKLDNEKLGLPVMTREQVKEIVKGCMI